MKLPRSVAGRDLKRALRRLGYEVTRETGSHMRLTTAVHGQHHVTIPDHSELRVGTLAAILDEVGKHHQLAREPLLRLLFA